MASNIKWFKRAYRSVLNGDTQAWNMMKKRLPQSRVSIIEETLSHLLGSPAEKVTEETKEIPKPEVSVKIKPKVSKTKKKASKKASTKNKNTKKTKKKSNEKSST